MHGLVQKIYKGLLISFYIYYQLKLEYFGYIALNKILKLILPLF